MRLLTYVDIFTDALSSLDTECGTRQNLADFVPTSHLVCIKMTSIPNSKSRLKNGGSLSKHCKVILSMKALARLKEQVESCTKCLETKTILKDFSMAFLCRVFVLEESHTVNCRISREKCKV